MRIENSNGLNILCGGILPLAMLEVGQQWVGVSSRNPVTIVAIDDNWITYESDTQPRNKKDSFSFQTRYCLVLDSENPTIPQLIV